MADLDAEVAQVVAGELGELAEQGVEDGGEGGALGGGVGGAVGGGGSGGDQLGQHGGCGGWREKTDCAQMFTV